MRRYRRKKVKEKWMLGKSPQQLYTRVEKSPTELNSQIPEAVARPNPPQVQPKSHQEKNTCST